MVEQEGGSLYTGSRSGDQPKKHQKQIKTPITTKRNKQRTNNNNENDNRWLSLARFSSLLHVLNIDMVSLQMFNYQKDKFKMWFLSPSILHKRPK